MSYQSKKLWDEVLDNIDPKYVNEAAELFGKSAGTAEEEIYDELTPVEVKALPQSHSKRRFIGGIVGFAAAAAVMAVTVGAAVRYMKNVDIVQPDPNDKSTSEGVVLKNTLDNIKLPTDPALYSEDYSIYEKYFFGRWKQVSGAVGYYGNPNRVRCVGYAPANSNLCKNSTYKSYDGLGFCEDEQGAYMAFFTYYKGVEQPDAEIIYSPKNDPDTLYHFDYSFVPGETPRFEADKVFVRDGEYVEENIGALNYFGVRKLCSEMGIDPALLYKDINYDDEELGLSIRLQNNQAMLGSEGIIVNFRSEDTLSFAVKCDCDTWGNNYLYYNFTVTKSENGEWGEPVLTDKLSRDELYDYDGEIPENSGEADYAVLEEYFLGEWQPQVYEDESSDALSIVYSDRKLNDEQLGGISSVFRADDGAYAFTVDGQVYFVPENDRQLLYRFYDGDASNYMVYRLEYCAAADSRDIYGSLTELGRSRLFDRLGEDFELAFTTEFDGGSIDNPDNLEFWCLNYNGEPPLDFVYIVSLSDSRAELAFEYYHTGTGNETYFVNIMEKVDGKWENTDSYYDINYDFGVLEELTPEFDLIVEEALGIYEDTFFGEWVSENGGYYSTLVCSYSEEIYGTSLPYAGNNGYYMNRLNGGAYEMFFIPYSDPDSMYFYGEVVFLSNDNGITTQKRDYSRKYTRNEKQYNTELRDMMSLSSFGLKKLYETAGGNFDEVFSQAEYRDDYILDKEGVSWKSGIYQGYLASADFDPVLVSMGDERIIISQTYYKPDPDEHVSDYNFDSTFENGMLKNFLLTFTKQDGVWICNISDTGESIDTIISFDMDMSIFPHFMGTWIDGETEYKLDYYNDFCEANVSWITGFEETDSMWLMMVHREAAGYNSPIIPDETGDTLFVINKDDPDTVKLYRYENAIPTGEPLKTFTRIGQLNTSFPDRGYISIYGLYALIDIMDDSSLESTIREYCFTGSVTAPGGETLYADPSEISKPEYVILERRYDRLKFATTFYNENKTQAYDYVVTLKRVYSGFSDVWHMSAYEPAIYGLDGAEKIPLENGSYYAFKEENDGTHLYFFDSSDSIIYELDEEVPDGATYVIDDSDPRYGSNLFVAELCDYGTWAVERYVDGKAMDSDASLCGYYTEIPENADVTLFIRGGYLIVKFEYDGGECDLVYCPSDMFFTTPIMVSDYIEILDDGFIIREGEELKTYTVNGDLEGVLPLLKQRAGSALSTLVMSTDPLRPDTDGLSIEKDGLTYYRTNNPLFRNYSDFKNYLKDAFTEELAEELLDNCNYITEYGDTMYAVAGGRGADITIAEVRESEPKLIDENTAEIVCEVYRWTDMEAEYSNRVMSEEPDEVYSLYLEKTENGWRFSNYYSPF